MRAAACSPPRLAGDGSLTFCSGCGKILAGHVLIPGHQTQGNSCSRQKEGKSRSTYHWDRCLTRREQQELHIPSSQPACLSMYFERFYLFIIYLFMRDTECERERERPREKQGPCKEPDAGLDPGPWDHALSQRQTFNC